MPPVLDPDLARALPIRAKMLALAGPLLGLFLAALDQTIVATSSPTMRVDLALEPALYVWIVMSYAVASTVCVPISGSLSDLLGRRPVLLSGIVVFVAGSTLCGTAASPVTMIAARTIQGAGAGALLTTVFAVIGDLFAPAERGRLTGIVGAVFGTASLLGPLVGGIVTDQIGWRWVFLVNVPLGGLALVIVARWLPRLAGLHRPGAPLRIDVPGTIALVGFVVPLLVAATLVSGGSVGGPGFHARAVLVLLAVSSAACVAFVAIERRAAQPIVPLELLRDRTFALVNLAGFAAGAGMLASAVFLPLYWTDVLGASATASGVRLVPLTLGMFASNVVAGHLAWRLRRTKAILIGATAVLAASFGVMAWVLRAGAPSDLEQGVLFLVGVGLGPTLPIVAITAQSSVPVARLGVATACTRFSRQLGATLGLALLGTVYARVLARSWASAELATCSAVSAVFVVAAVFAAAAMLCTMRMPECHLRAAGISASSRGRASGSRPRARSRSA